MIKGVYAIQIKTRNLDALRKFYSKTLGLKVNHTCAGCTILEMDGGGRWAIQKNSQAAQDLGETSPVSVVFAVDDVLSLYKKATEEGAKSASAPQDESWGATTATILDPDGNKVVLLKEKPEVAKTPPCCAHRQETPDEAPISTKVPAPPKSPAPKPKGKAKP